MRLSFDSIDEVREFVKSLKGARGGKSEDPAEDKAPPPLPPPNAGPSAAALAFNPNATPPATGGGPFGGGAIAANPVNDLVTRIAKKIDESIAAGHDQVAALGWFRGECQKCGLDASNATMDQIKAGFLAKMPQPVLENIAKLMMA